MTFIGHWRFTAAALAAGSALALSSCMVSPGTFTASLDLRGDGRFSFAYDGQIYLLALSQLNEMANETKAADEFVEQPCYDDEDFEERPCTAAETAEQRESWEQRAASRRAESEREAEAMRAMFGGLDLDDPAAAEELAERLRRQEGWQRVDYRGEGLFEVEFAIRSTLGHDFAFPTFERFPMSNSFVTVNLRQGRQVRIDAPGFAAQGGHPLQAMLAGMAGMMPSDEADTMPRAPEMNGTFRVVTDGRILANNTDAGPARSGGDQVLEWKVNRRTQSPPTALIEIGG